MKNFTITDDHHGLTLNLYVDQRLLGPKYLPKVADYGVARMIELNCDRLLIHPR